MPFKFRHVEKLGDSIEVPIARDDDGYLGRECPVEECEGYFLVKPGTGLTGENLLCRCPYCGHPGPSDHFWTKEQIEYARSMALRQITAAFHRDLKQLEFNHPPRGAFGIGIRMTVTPGVPVPIRHYREKALETFITCTSCTLEYGVYGVFGYCPDCGEHNSLQILEKNLDLTRKQVILAGELHDDALRRHLLEDALENCVSALDGFGRETVRVRAAMSTAPARCENVPFQNLDRAADRLVQLFGVDLRTAIAPELWAVARRGFMKRHVVAHRAGVVDDQYVTETGDHSAVTGRRVPLDPAVITAVADAVLAIGAELVRVLPKPVPPGAT